MNEKPIPTLAIGVGAVVAAVGGCCMCALAPLVFSILCGLTTIYCVAAGVGRAPWRGPRWVAFLVAAGSLGMSVISAAYYVQKDEIVARVQAERQAEEARAAEHAAAERAAEAQRERERIARQAQLRQEAQQRLATITQQIDAAEAQINAGDYEDASVALGAPLAAAGELAGMPNPPTGAPAALQRAQATHQRAVGFISARQSIESATTTATGARAAARDNALHTQQNIDNALAALNAIQGEPADEFHSDIARARRNLERASRSIAPQVRRQEREIRRLAELMVRCGTKPSDLRVRVESTSLMEQAAHDPDSIEVDNCSEPQLDNRACWTWSCNVRGRNMFGALVLNRRRFQMDARRISDSVAIRRRASVRLACAIVKGRRALGARSSRPSCQRVWMPPFVGALVEGEHRQAAGATRDVPGGLGGRWPEGFTARVASRRASIVATSGPFDEGRLESGDSTSGGDRRPRSTGQRISRAAGDYLRSRSRGDGGARRHGRLALLGAGHPDEQGPGYRRSGPVPDPRYGHGPARRQRLLTGAAQGLRSRTGRGRMDG